MPQTFIQELLENLDPKNLKKVNGDIEIQILIDSLGKPCLLSANNKTNAKLSKLTLQKAVNNTSFWKPAISELKLTQSSVSLVLSFEKGNLSINRRILTLQISPMKNQLGHQK